MKRLISNQCEALHVISNAVCNQRKALYVISYAVCNQPSVALLKGGSVHK